jgi:hypothetical protein
VTAPSFDKVMRILKAYHADLQDFLRATASALVTTRETMFCLISIRLLNSSLNELYSDSL